jgi:hypothetical protein
MICYVVSYGTLLLIKQLYIVRMCFLILSSPCTITSGVFLFLLKVGVKESIVNASRITDHESVV